MEHMANTALTTKIYKIDLKIFTMEKMHFLDEDYRGTINKKETVLSRNNNSTAEQRRCKEGKGDTTNCTWHPCESNMKEFVANYSQRKPKSGLEELQ